MPSSYISNSHHPLAKPGPGPRAGPAVAHAGDLETRCPEGDGYCIVDYPDARLETLPEWVPCSLHIDHHTPFPNQPVARIRSINTACGAASTIIAVAVFDENARFPHDKKRLLASALLAGILTDTDQMRLAGDMDRTALGLLSHLADDRLVRRISLPTLSSRSCMNRRKPKNTRYPTKAG